ncbi:hypothetical protein H257_12857 [Aphanomyces astaci]|uniref:Uncharacterized protein n=1 Tax=Aphanomyces astaci TaxID=112090 RepID=W4FX35_APHAT|nr:hypothetical protein H257_12857 [Aphanomyces astaci]ETV72065.1 hypothetical protein H257_12857 [Aphanomyces astaci]|eukprot:XP_009838508.1 hypothetical protein H257_12857 [Aphanomyces astaci]
MLKRYVAIRGFVHQLNDRTILSLLSTDEQDKEIDILLGILGELESGTKDQQAEDSTILDARNLFDETILLYPDAAKRLGPNADILVSPNFESAVTKLLNNAAGQLSAVERESVCGLQMYSPATQNPSDKPLTLAERAKKRKKTSHEDRGKSEHLDVLGVQAPTQVNVASSGYTNLYSLLKLKHPGLAGIYAEAIGQNSKSAPLDAWFDPKATNIFNWIEWLIMNEHEFTFVESQLTRKNSTLKPISVKTIKRYCFKLVKAVERRVSSAMAGRPYSIVFDGWSNDSTHFLGMFVSLPNVYASIEKWFVCLIGDNCSTNKATVNLFSRLLIGCHSHRLNLAVDQFLKANVSDVLSNVAAVMVKLRSLKAGGPLRLTTMLKPKLRNATRWTGAVSMF